MAIIEVAGLSFSYDKKTVLSDINVSFLEHKFYTIVGPNGSGKTTMLRNIAKILKPASGKISVGGNRLSVMQQEEVSKQIAFVPQETDIPYSFSVFDVVMMGRLPHAKVFRGESMEDLRVVKAAMEVTDTWRLKDRDITKISGGEKQRVIVARAIAQATPIIILDEPVGNLDMFHQVGIMETLKNLQLKMGVTVITVLHDLNLAAKYSDYCVLMNEGRVIATDTPQNILTVENIRLILNIDCMVMPSPTTGTLMIVPS